jgi:uncharacterized membrane protein YfcA
VPLLIALGLPFLEASTMSLVVVGTGAAAALVPHQRAGRVDWRVGLTFGALGAVGAALGARVAGLLPPPVLLGGLTALLVAGATAMLGSGLRAREAARTPDSATEPDPGAEVAELALARAERTPTPSGRITGRVLGLATSVGVVTGVFGVGAGFVVVPALVSGMRVPVKRATATALVVIVMNSAVALAVRHGAISDPRATVELAMATAVFAVVGALVSRRVPGWVLALSFGTLLAVAAAYTLVRALISG